MTRALEGGDEPPESYLAKKDSTFQNFIHEIKSQIIHKLTKNS